MAQQDLLGWQVSYGEQPSPGGASQLGVPVLCCEQLPHTWRKRREKADSGFASRSFRVTIFVYIYIYVYICKYIYMYIYIYKCIVDASMAAVTFFDELVLGRDVSLFASFEM